MPSYYNEICGELDKFNGPALKYGDTRAWVNRKAKADKRILPRGKVFSRLDKQEWNIFWASILELEAGVQAS